MLAHLCGHTGLFEEQTTPRGQQAWDVQEKRELPKTDFRHKLVSRFAVEADRNWEEFQQNLTLSAKSKKPQNAAARKLWKDYCSTTKRPVDDAVKAYEKLRDVAKDLASELLASLQSKSTEFDVGIYNGGQESGLPGFFRRVCFTKGAYSATGCEQGTDVEDDEWRKVLHEMIPHEKSAVAVGNWKVGRDGLLLLRSHLLDQQMAPCDKQASFGVHTDDTLNEGDFRSIITVVALLTDGQADGLTVYADGRRAVRCDYTSDDGDISMLAFPSCLPHATTTTTQHTSGKKITFFFGRAWDRNTDLSSVR